MAGVASWYAVVSGAVRPRHALSWVAGGVGRSGSIVGCEFDPVVEAADGAHRRVARRRAWPDSIPSPSRTTGAPEHQSVRRVLRGLRESVDVRDFARAFVLVDWRRRRHSSPLGRGATDSGVGAHVRG